MNRVLLIGRITKNLELRETKTGKKVCEFTIATNRVNGKEADFVNCMLWDKQAENLAKYQGKGSLVGVSGELRTETYEIEGKNRHKTFVLVNNIEYLSQTQKTENTPKNDFDSASIKTEFHDQLEIEENDLPW
jgi:single-strand DNA-binding protein